MKSYLLVLALSPFLLRAQSTTLTGTVSLGTVQSITALRAGATSGINNGDYVQVSGYYAPNDGGGGTYVWNGATSPTMDNGGTIIHPTSAVSGCWSLQYAGPVNILWFGAYPNGSNPSATATAIQAAVTLANSNGGSVFVPSGNYDIGSTTLNLANNVVVYGQNRSASVIIYSGIGDALALINATNAFTAAHAVVRDLGISSTNASATGADLDFVGGAFIEIHGVKFSGNKWGLVFDQTEVSKVDYCDFELQSVGGLWLVNGPDHTGGAGGDYTNEISLSNCQFNASSSTPWAVVDDGGFAHRYASNSFNGFAGSMRIAGTSGCRVDACEFEGWNTSAAIGSYNTTYVLGGSVNQNQGLSIANNFIQPTSGQSCVSFVNGGLGVTLEGNYLGATSATKVLTPYTATGLNLLANVDGGGGGATYGIMPASAIQFATNGVLSGGNGTVAGTYITSPTVYNAAGTLQNPMHVVTGVVVNSGGVSTISLTGSAQFTSAFTYQVMATDRSVIGAVQVNISSGSQFTVNTSAATDTVSYVAIGY